MTYFVAHIVSCLQNICDSKLIVVKSGSLAAAFWSTKSKGKQQVSIITSLLTRENHQQQQPCQLFSSTVVSCSDCTALFFFFLSLILLRCTTQHFTVLCVGFECFHKPLVIHSGSKTYCCCTQKPMAPPPSEEQ